MNIIERVKAPTPKFFRVLRTIGLSVAAAGGALLASPVSLPMGIITLAGYLTVAGTVMTAVSQTAVENPDADASAKEKSAVKKRKRSVSAG